MTCIKICIARIVYIQMVFIGMLNIFIAISSYLFSKYPTHDVNEAYSNLRVE